MGPLSLRPGSDLMVKGVTRNSSVIKIITTALVNETDDYNIADSEWSNGCRSDLVLEPKSPSFGLPPIVIEFQQSVNNIFMKRAIQYSLQAYQRYQVDPIILIICMNSLSSDIESLTKPSHILGCRSYPCHSWADKCLIISKTTLNTLTPSQQSDPFVAFGLFLTQSTAITDLALDDPTMNHLKSLALDHYSSLIGNEVHLADFVKDLLDTQEKQYQHLLTLASQQNSSHALQVSIQNAQAQQHELKRKFDELDTSPSIAVPSTTSSAALPSPSSNASSSSTSLYERGMAFVLQFKAARIKQGKERMDWKACMEEGHRNGLLLNYKNTNTLKNQFMKFEKSQQRNK